MDLLNMCESLDFINKDGEVTNKADCFGGVFAVDTQHFKSTEQVALESITNEEKAKIRENKRQIALSKKPVITNIGQKTIADMRSLLSTWN